MSLGSFGYKWIQNMQLPLVIGHEGSGEIVELGSAIKDIKVGDHVVFQFSPSGRCRRCLEEDLKFVN